MSTKNNEHNSDCISTTANETNTTKVINEEGIRTTLSLSLTTSDKKKLKLMALDQDITIAGLIHNWINEKYEVKE